MVGYLWEREGIEHLYNAKKYLNFWKTAKTIDLTEHLINTFDKKNYV